MEKGRSFLLLSRYLFLIILGIPNLYLFYLILTPLTVYPVLWILNSIYGANLLANNIIFVENVYTKIIPACVGGAAYYLLTILNLTTPMSIKKRIKSLIFLFSTFFAINIARIVLFVVLFTQGFQYFDLAHITSWYFGSTIMVILIWFSNVMIFKIKKLPILSDLKDLSKDITIKNKKFINPTN